MSNFDRELLGQKIRHYRESLGLSQLQLANSVGKSSAAYIALIEGGDRNIGSLDLLLIAKKLGVTVSELLEEKREGEVVKFSELLRSSSDLQPTERKEIENFYNFIKQRKDEGYADPIGDAAEPRYRFAQAKALEMWRVFGIESIPVDVNKIVKELGIHLQGVEFQKADGSMRTYSDGIWVINYNKTHAEERQRFTIAHEFGHIVLEHSHLDGSTSQPVHDCQEKEANTFARELLIPTPDLKKFVGDKNKTLEDISMRYAVSKEAAFYAVSNNKLINKIKANS